MLVRVPIATTGCGGAAAGHRAYRIYGVYGAFHDLTHNHLLWGALNAHQALVTARRASARTSGEASYRRPGLPAAAATR